MIYWAPFLHFYQPPTQFHAILKKICKESYRPLLKIFAEHPQAKVTVNIAGVLTEAWNDHGGEDIIQTIAELGKLGRLEFVESAKYHAILPLIPEEEVRRQIELNHKTNEYFYKKAYKPRGFFPPEMCYSNELGRILSELGYEWVILSGAACTANWPLDVIYKVNFSKNKLTTFFRDDILSNKISFQNIDIQGFMAELTGLAQGKEDIYVITAMDAETFGHHIQHWEELFLGELYETLEGGAAEYANITHDADVAKSHKDILDSEVLEKIKVVTISELLDKFPIKVSAQPSPSSWSTSKDEIARGDFYPLWNDPANPIHKLQWDHIDICFELVNTASNLKGNKESQHSADVSRSLLDRAIHSCQFWWANKGRMWDINMINMGLILQEEVLLNAYKAISSSGCEEKIRKNSYRLLVSARDIAYKIRDYLF